LLLIAVVLAMGSAEYQTWLLLSPALLCGSIAARWLRIGRIARSSPLDLPILLFSISVVVAWWVAPTRDDATVRLVWYLASVALFYSLISSDAPTRLLLGKMFALAAAVGGIVLVGQRDWSDWTRFAIIGRIGRAFNQIIPNFGFELQNWNVTRNHLATALALAVPFAIMWVIYAVQTRREHARVHTIVEISLALLAIILLGFGLVMSESRTPFLLLPVMAMIVVWWLVVTRFGRISHPLRVFWLGIGAFVVIGVIALFVLAPVIPQLPGPDTFTARRNIYKQSLYLAQVAPFTGAGLYAFPRYYSEYVRVVPVNAVFSEDTGNNAYQIVWIGQGLLGIVALVWLLAGAAWSTTRYLGQLSRPHPFIVAGAISLAYVILHSAIHAVIIYSRVTPLLLLPAGFALAGYPIASRKQRVRDWWQKLATDRRYQLAVIGVVTIVVIFSFAQWRQLRASWIANTAVLAMARQQFADWPRGEWDDGSMAEQLVEAERLFDKALTLNPDNAVAHHRLGLIAMLRRDYGDAVDHLTIAQAHYPGHDGIRKNLGYSLTWLGEYDAALPLLRDVAEARTELDIYAWWWQTQDEAAFSQHAAAMSARLAAAESEQN
jgi:tetratricopeptide (TPR) repeat protein